MQRYYLITAIITGLSFLVFKKFTGTRLALILVVGSFMLASLFPFLWVHIGFIATLVTILLGIALLGTAAYYLKVYEQQIAEAEWLEEKFRVLKHAQQPGVFLLVEKV